MYMSDIKYFHLGQFFTKRAFIATFIGVAFVALTEFVLPWLGILQIETLWQWISPATITFTIAIIMVSCAIAKNLVSSIFISTAAILSFYDPYSTVALKGFIAVVIIYMITAFFAGWFATMRITGRTALLITGIVIGLQGLIGAGVSMFTSIAQTQNNFHTNSIGIAYSSLIGTIPIYDIIVAAFSVIYMVVFIIISRKRTTIEQKGKKKEIFGQILIFLSIVGALLFIILSHVNFDQNTAISIFGETNTQFLNSIFAKTTAGGYMAIKLLNVFYILPIVGFVIGIGIALIIYQRASGTTNFMRLNYEGAYLSLNFAPFLIICSYSYIFQNAIGSADFFFIRTSTWFTLFTEFTNLLLINFLVAYILFIIISIIRNLIKK